MLTVHSFKKKEDILSGTCKTLITTNRKRGEKPRDALSYFVYVVKCV